MWEKRFHIVIQGGNISKMFYVFLKWEIIKYYNYRFNQVNDTEELSKMIFQHKIKDILYHVKKT